MRKFTTINGAVLGIVSIAAFAGFSGGAILALAGAGVIIAAAINTLFEYKINKKICKDKESYKKKAQNKTDIDFKEIYEESLGTLGLPLD